ncbi:hypothetical protein IF2G_07421 [Cordyceps javanica]|nr:hypothetical protein IF2G_07421 [Cordyceps javanica]
MSWCQGKCHAARCPVGDISPFLLGRAYMGVVVIFISLMIRDASRSGMTAMTRSQNSADLPTLVARIPGGH